MKKLILLPCFFLICLASSFAETPDEGMWLPMYLKKMNEKSMQKLGLKLTADDIYNVNNASLKDAVVSFGGFCTGEIVSSQGLVLTNHHCGYDAIQKASTTEKNYLANGFWAYAKDQEIPAEGLFVRILVRMEDVTEQVKTQLKADKSNLRQIFTDIQKKAVEGTVYDARVAPIFNSNQYILNVYETFKDIRLVGTAPEAIGKFGGDTDNWMWPRHTGDFSVFRIYANKDNKPAEYSKENIPYTPKKHLAISLKGLKENDYVMIIGYPGRTNRYLTGASIQAATDYTNQAIINTLETQTTTMKEAMDADPKVRLTLASDYASLMNTYKYYIGQTLGLKKNDLVGKKTGQEAEFMNWLTQDASRKDKYGAALANIDAIVKEVAPLNKQNIYLTRTLLSNALIGNGAGLDELEKLLNDKNADKTKIDEAAKTIKGGLESAYKDYDQNTDEKIFAALLNRFYTDIEKDKHPIFLATILAKYPKLTPKDAFSQYAKDVYAQSMLVNKDRFTAFLNNPTAKLLKKDLGYEYVKNIYPEVLAFSQKIASKQGQLDVNRQLFVEGMMEMNPNTNFYPDANSTCRVTYGSVNGYLPADAVTYNYQTTLEGIIQKEDPKNEEFIVPAGLKQIWKDKNYGDYAQNGTVPVAFLSNNDITGGNSGSPVMNANGELVGIAFDGNWEAMTGDLMFNNAVQRTISVDIRYVLLCIDKLGGAKNLIQEMTLIK